MSFCQWTDSKVTFKAGSFLLRLSKTVKIVILSDFRCHWSSLQICLLFWNCTPARTSFVIRRRFLSKLRVWKLLLASTKELYITVFKKFFHFGLLAYLSRRLKAAVLACLQRTEVMIFPHKRIRSSHLSSFLGGSWRLLALNVHGRTLIFLVWPWRIDQSYNIESGFIWYEHQIIDFLIFIVRISEHG